MDERESSPREADAFLKSNRITLPHGPRLRDSISPILLFFREISRSSRSPYLVKLIYSVFIALIYIRFVRSIMRYGWMLHRYEYSATTV